MRRAVGIVVAGALVAVLAAPLAPAAGSPAPTGVSIVWIQDHGQGDSGSDEAEGYRHHERYRGNHYDYNKHRNTDPYSEDGPYDGYYHCRRYGPPHYAETWCDHYYGRQPRTES